MLVLFIDSFFKKQNSKENFLVQVLESQQTFLSICNKETVGNFVAFKATNRSGNFSADFCINDLSVSDLVSII